jgi:hypothetical protein
MSIISHENIEKSFYEFLNDNLTTPYGYVINYGETRFETNSYDLWLSVEFESIGAGAKSKDDVRIDIFSRITNVQFNNDEALAIDRIRERLTNVNIQLYDYSSGSAVIVENQKLIIKNDQGRFTVNRVLLDNLRAEDLAHNLRRSSVMFSLELLSDTVGGRTI